MSSSPIDSFIFRNMFGTPSMRAVFSDASLIQRYVEVEVALARAEARLGIIPESAAAQIAQAAPAFKIDEERFARETENVGYPILPLVKQFAEFVGEPGRYLHWGATTQDIMDTALVLQLREGVAQIEEFLAALQAHLETLSGQHRDTLMAGRTHLQHALPVTFGYKAAVWLSMFDRHWERLQELKPRLLVGAFSGAAGTLASLGTQGLHVQAEFCRELGLGVPSITWHVARDALIEAVAFLGNLTASLAKIATDIALMMSNEFGEVAEPFVEGRGASSTMPQKRNPISCEMIIGNAKIVRQNVALAMDAGVHDFERSTGPWQAEWLLIPQSFILAAGACHNAVFMLAGLSVDADRMRRNLALTNGLIVAEAVMMAAAPVLGRQHSHDVIYTACRVAADTDRSLMSVLLEDTSLVEALGGQQRIESLCNAENYLGSAPEMVDRLLRERARKGGSHAQ